MTKVPNSILLASTKRGGTRLPKLKKYWQQDNYNHRHLPGHYHPAPNYGNVRTFQEELAHIKSMVATDKGKKFKKEGLPTVQGNLSNDDYQYWVGARTMVSEYCKCRACGKVLYPATLKARKEHNEVWACSKQLQMAIRLLVKDTRCVVCGTVGKHRKWGVPICSEACQLAWMFDTHALYPVMLTALREAELQMRNKGWWKAR